MSDKDQAHREALARIWLVADLILQVREMAPLKEGGGLKAALLDVPTYNRELQLVNDRLERRLKARLDDLAKLPVLPRVVALERKIK